MCQSVGTQNKQIEKYVENGMPQKIVKTVKRIMDKRDINSTAFVTEDEEMTAQTTSATPETSDFNKATTATTAKTATIDVNVKEMEYIEKTNLSEVKNTLKIPAMCGRFKKLQSASKQQQQQTMKQDATTQDTHASNAKQLTEKNEDEVYVDALAWGTQLTKQFVQRLSHAAQELQNSRIYTLLTKTTQPAHIIAICILSFVLLTVWPDLFDGTSTGTTAASIDGVGANIANQKNSNALAVIAYLGAFATHFGAQIWMTFVSGLSLYFSLPRHTFGQCQQILFPKYFALNAVLSITMLILHVKYFLSNWNAAGCVQLASLALTAAIEVVVRLYLAPPMLRLMLEKYKIEGAIGSGQEVGSLVQGDLVQCPHYQRIHKTFRRIHMTIAMGNMVILLNTCLHLYFLASKIQIS